MLNAFASLLDRIGRIERAFGIALIFGIVIAITVQVVTRYAFDRPIAWVEESATYAFIWMVFVGASAGLKLGRHIVIESFHKLLNPRAAASLRLLIWLLVLALMVTLIVQGVKVMGVEGRSKTISLPIDIARMWFYSVPLSLSAASMALTTAYFIVMEYRAVAGIDLPSPAPLTVVAHR